MAPTNGNILSAENGNSKLDIDFNFAGSLTLSGTSGFTV
jgi:hypothetical protein